MRCLVIFPYVIQYICVDSLLQRCRNSNVILLTSSLATLLHAVLVNVQCEQHVGVSSVFLICIGLAGAARSNGCIQEEGCFLGCWGTKLTLILELQGEEDRVGMS